MSGGDQALSFIYFIGVLILVGSALMVRRIPIASGLKMAAAWLLIFGAVFVAFTLKDDFVALGQRVLTESRGDGAIVQAGDMLRIKKGPDGHFWIEGKINGEAVRFLVDSGATTTSISVQTARRAGIDSDGGFPAVVQTANGMISVQRARADLLKVGSIERHNVAVHVSEGFGEINVLGMNFLSTLSAWGVEGQWLVLKP